MDSAVKSVFNSLSSKCQHNMFQKRQENNRTAGRECEVRCCSPTGVFLSPVYCQSATVLPPSGRGCSLFLDSGGVNSFISVKTKVIGLWPA